MSVEQQSTSQRAPSEPVVALPYATPTQFHTDMSGVWQDGALLVTTRTAALPDFCVKCAAPADGWRWKKTVYWHNPLLFLMILFPGLLIYAIVALIVRQKATIEAGLCPMHRKQRGTRILLTWLIALAGLAAFISGIVMSGSRQTQDVGITLIIAGLLVLIVAGVVGAATTGVLKPTKIEGNYAWFKGASRAFLELLPPAR